MAKPSTVTEFNVEESSTPTYRATLVDEDGVAVPSSSLTTMTLSLVHGTTGAVINNRNEQDVLNAHDVTIDNAGALVWSIQQADTSLAEGDLEYQIHKAIFTATFVGGRPRLVHEVWLRIRNVPTLHA